MMLEARCRNCGNTGISPWTDEPCGCLYGKALAQIVVDKQAGETVGVAGMSESFITHMQRKVQRSQDAFPDDWRTRYTFYDGEVANLLEAVLAQPTPQQSAQAHNWDEDDRMSGFFVLVNHELARARRKHGPMHSHHEAYAVLLEELDEVWAETKSQKPDPQRIIAELIQVAAMCARWAEDVCASDGKAGDEP